MQHGCAVEIAPAFSCQRHSTVHEKTDGRSPCRRSQTSTTTAARPLHVAHSQRFSANLHLLSSVLKTSRPNFQNVQNPDSECPGQCCGVKRAGALAVTVTHCPPDGFWPYLTQLPRLPQGASLVPPPCSSPSPQTRLRVWPAPLSL